jgi:uncharacterized protein YggE
MKNGIVAIVTVLGVLPMGNPCDADESKTPPPSLSVTGTGKLEAAPDVAEITLGVRTQETTAEKALAANSEAMTKVHAVLKERGVAAKDIQTTQIQISPVYSQPEPHPVGDNREFVPRLIGYQVDNNVQITARQIAKLGSLIDGLVQAGANQVGGISFRVSDPDKLLDELRRRAMIDAKRKAELLAGEAGVVVGLPLKIELDEDGSAVPSPHYMALGRAGMMAAQPTAPAPIAPGQQELRVRVHVTYRILEPK